MPTSPERVRSPRSPSPTPAPRFAPALALACALALGLSGCDVGPDELLLARAADHRLTVDETVRMMSGAADQVSNEPPVIEAVANLWVDYTLLAEAMAEDSTLSHIDPGPLVRQRTESERILALWDSVVVPDTAISEDEVVDYFAAEAPGTEVHASHILIAFPQSGGTEAQVDSLRSAAEEVRRRAVAGEDFAELAERYSQDPGSARRGGDLGRFSRGQMVRPFDEAVFGLEEGEISEVVETPYGFHVITLHEKVTPELDDARDQVRARLIQARTRAAESTYVADLMADVEVELAEDGIELTRQMARNPRTPLRDRAARRPVAEYDGGEITVGEVQDLMLTRQPSVRARLADLPDAMLEEGIIRDLVQKEILLERATAGGFETSAETVDSLTRVARERFVETARRLGIASIEVQPGESREDAVYRVVLDRIEQILQGRREIIPVDAIGYILRRHYPSEVYDDVAIPRVVERVAEARGPATDGAAGPNGGAGQPDTGTGASEQPGG